MKQKITNSKTMILIQPLLCLSVVFWEGVFETEEKSMNESNKEKEKCEFQFTENTSIYDSSICRWYLVSTSCI